MNPTPTLMAPDDTTRRVHVHGTNTTRSGYPVITIDSQLWVVVPVGEVPEW